MIEQLPRSHGAVLGFRAVGDVTDEDYQVMTPVVKAAVDEHGSIRLVLDLTEFRWEKVDAWGADLRFGSTFRHSVERMAIVGDRAWERWLARLAEPFYAQSAEFFSDVNAAWAWVEK